MFKLKWLCLWIRLQFIKIYQTLVMLGCVLTGKAVVQVIVEGGIVTDVMGLPRNTRYEVFDWDILDGNTFEDIALYLRGFGMTISAEDVERRLASGPRVMPDLEDDIADEIIWRW